MDSTGETGESEPSYEPTSMDVVPGATPGKELIIGLVTPIGTETAVIAERIRSALSDWNYFSYIIKLSKYLDNKPNTQNVEYEDHRINRLIDAGNARCEAMKNRAAVAMIAVSTIVRLRMMRRQPDGNNSSAGISDIAAAEAELITPLEDRTAYILHSLKRVDEVNLLRSIYGPQFILVGCQDSEEARRQNLEGKYLSDPSAAGRATIVAKLMQDDASQDHEYGQNVNSMYALADYFLGVDEDATRFVNLLFGDPREVVRPAEQAMFAAYMASGTSLSGSRKVGAALAKDSSLLAIGSNNVPEGEKADVHRGIDFSEQLKQQIVSDIVTELKASVEVLKDVPSEDLSETIQKTSVSNIIEGQRAVHAEAAAISDFARRGGSLRDTELYVTTFPCHLCFKLAIDSALANVFYIYPYPKSRARQMFPDSVALLKPYEGVAPRFYDSTFVQRELPTFNKTDYTYEAPDKAVAKPWIVGERSPRAIFVREKEILDLLNQEKPHDETDANHV